MEQKQSRIAQYTADLISVIVPVYNVAEYLPRCLDSIVRNTYKQLQIICINDGSTDNSLEILQEYASQDSRIAVVDKLNGGLSSARNAGLRLATGEFIAYIDSDDWIHEEYFAFLHRAIRQENADIAICDYVRTKDELALKRNVEYRVRPMSVAEMSASFSVKTYVWKRLFRHETVAGICFDEQVKTEDIVYNTQVVQKNRHLKIAYVDAVLYAYYIRQGSLAGNINEMDQFMLASRYLSDAEAEKQPETREILADESIKRALAARYVFICSGRKTKVMECNEIIREAKMLKHRQKIRYELLYRLPVIYRAFRIITDPTMLQYEKQLKKRKSKKTDNEH